FRPGGFLFFSWVVPASVLVLVIGLAYLRFWLALPPRSRSLFLLAACTYLGGALGLEMVEGAWAAAHGMGTPGFVLISTISETLEMMGAIVLVYALLDHMGREVGELRLQIEREPRTRVTP